MRTTQHEGVGPHEGRRDEEGHTRADREFHEATAHLYDEVLMPIFGIYYRLEIGPALDWLARDAPGREALDLGAGTGGITTELGRRGFRVTAIDHSPAMLAHAEAKVREQGLEHVVRLQTGDVRRLPFDDGSFDAVTCQGVLHHLIDMRGAVGEVARVLRPGGVFYIAEPCRGSSLALRTWDRARSALGRFRRTDRSHPPGHGETEIPDHEEGPIDAAELIGLLRQHSLEPRVRYSTQFEGLERLPPRLQAAVVAAATRPWRHRSGNLIYVTGRRAPATD